MTLADHRYPPLLGKIRLKPGTQDFPAVLEDLVLLGDPGEKVGVL